MAYITSVREVNSNASAELVTGIYQTGIIDISKYDKPAIVRRINLNYESYADITCEVYGEGRTSGTAICTVTFPANKSGAGLDSSRIVSRRPVAGARAKAISVVLTTPNNNASVIIRKLEIEIDG